MEMQRYKEFFANFLCCSVPLHKSFLNMSLMNSSDF